MPTQISDVPENLLSDFDLVADPEMMRNPQQRMTDALVNDGRDIFYTPHNGGHWIVTNYEMGHEILSNPELYGSFPIGVPANYEQRPRLIPLESDPQSHPRYRRLLLPVFAPNIISKMEDKIRQRTISVLEEALQSPEIDFLWDIAKPIPTGVFLEMLGLPQHMQPQFCEWENGFYRAETVEARVDYGQKIAHYLSQAAEDHVTNPRDDVMSMLLEVEVEGERLSRDEVDAICYLLFLSGVDTVAAMLTFIANYLAQNRDLYQKIKADKEFLETATDELLRMHAFINLNRICEADTEFHGVHFKQGDNIVVPSFVTDRDAATFPDPHNFNPERSKVERNMHHAFGDGPHKCIGMHLAKLEVKIVLEEFAKRVEAFSITDESKISAHGGTTMGMDNLPITWTA
ncbi:MAG: cytochrome P450 [Alphaproteobacteria bacterium]|nr:cytochrome P450 [Alphaproteobacteria bacterium]